MLLLRARASDSAENSSFYSENKSFLSISDARQLADVLIGRYTGRLINCNPKVTTVTVNHCVDIFGSGNWQRRSVVLK